jgi:hypothetical protein
MRYKLHTHQSTDFIAGGITQISQVHITHTAASANAWSVFTSSAAIS